MAKLTDRVKLFLSQIFFTLALIPLFISPGFAGYKLVRRFVAYFFGKFLAGRYRRVIEFYGKSYGAALEDGLKTAASLAAVEPNRIIDCGTGTGFAAKEAALTFPHSTVIGIDITPEMLNQARQDAASGGLQIAHVYADTMYLPFADHVIDLVIAHNTIPFLIEFGRVCRPGGVVLIVDTAARWIAPFARHAASRTKLFDAVVADQAGLGFYLAIRRKV